MWGFALRRRLTSRKFLDGSGAVAQITASDRFEDAHYRRKFNQADNKRILVARGQDNADMSTGLGQVPIDPCVRMQLGIDLGITERELSSGDHTCSFCGTIVASKKVSRCCGKTGYCCAYCQYLDWQNHRPNCSRLG
jgi:hypothetical protein